MKISGTDLGIVGDLLAYEVDLTNPADGRRVISEERVGVCTVRFSDPARSVNHDWN